MVALTQLSALALVSFGLLCALATSVLYSRLRPALMAQGPASRARRLLALCVAPAFGAVLLTVVCFVPSALGMFRAEGDHCASHGGQHPHFCAVHVTSTSGGLLGWLIPGLVASALGVDAVRRLGRMLRARRALEQVTHAAVLDPERGLWLVESDLPLAVTTGLLRPRIFLSSGLIRGLPAELLAAVIEHERAHARRLDVPRKLVAGLAGALLPARTRRRLLADLDLAMEQACDEEAGARVGDRLRVARALIAVQRLVHGSRLHLAPAAASFGGRSVAPRLTALLAPKVAERPGHLPVWLAVTMLALALLSEPIHHQTETVLGLLTR